MLLFRAWTDWPVLVQLSERQAVCITDTGPWRAKWTMLVNECLRKTEKEEKEEDREDSANDLETKAVLSSAPTAQTNTIIDEE